jgi:hypothetical protein
MRGTADFIVASNVAGFPAFTCATLPFASVMVPFASVTAPFASVTVP